MWGREAGRARPRVVRLQPMNPACLCLRVDGEGRHAVNGSDTSACKLLSTQHPSYRHTHAHSHTHTHTHTQTPHSDCPFADINECTSGDHDCPDGSICSNTDGSFTCNCVYGSLQGDACYGWCTRSDANTATHMHACTHAQHCCIQHVTTSRLTAPLALPVHSCAAIQQHVCVTHVALLQPLWLVDQHLSKIQGRSPMQRTQQ